MIIEKQGGVFYRVLGPAWPKKDNLGDTYYSCRLSFEAIEWLYHVTKEYKKNRNPKRWVSVLVQPDRAPKKRGSGWPTWKVTNPYRPR